MASSTLFTPDSTSPHRLRDAPVVFVVDDDVSVRESLELLILSAGWNVETFRSAEEFLLRRQPATQSCVILDINLPDLNGLDVQKRIAAKAGLPIIFITAYGNVQLAVRAIKAGAVEFLTKPLRRSALLTAIEAALRQSCAALAAAAEAHVLHERYASLSPREREVMQLVVRGMLNKHVGAELGISEITVKAHRGKVMRKMMARSLADLVKFAAQLALISIGATASVDTVVSETPTQSAWHRTTS